MRLVLAAVSAAFLASSSASAAISPRPGPGDPHIQTVEYSAQEVVILHVALNFALTIEFSPDERVENVSVGNSSAWQIALNKSANRLFVKPADMSGETDMTVVTDTRIYTFELSAAPSPDASTAYVLHFIYPEAPQGRPADASLASPRSSYRFGGARELRPLSMSDDGQETTIVWPPKTPFPEVSIVDQDGRESLANGGVRNGGYVIDEVADHFVFRAEGRTASATRHLVKARQP